MVWRRVASGAPGSRTQPGLRQVSRGGPGYLRGRGRGGSRGPGALGPHRACDWARCRAGKAESAAESARARDPLGLVTHFIPVTTRARLERRPMGRWGGQLLRGAPALAAAGARRDPRSERPPPPPRAGSVSGRGSGARSAGCAGPRASDWSRVRRAGPRSACAAGRPGCDPGSPGAGNSATKFISVWVFSAVVEVRGSQQNPER